FCPRQLDRTSGDGCRSQSRPRQDDHPDRAPPDDRARLSYVLHDGTWAGDRGRHLRRARSRQRGLPSDARRRLLTNGGCEREGNRMMQAETGFSPGGGTEGLVLAIVSPSFNQVSETFVADHVRTLAPGRTVLVCQNGTGAAA